MWKQFFKNTWLLICAAGIGIAGLTVFLWSDWFVKGEAYAGSYSALISMGVILILSISCVGDKAGDISNWYRILLLLDMILSLTTIVTNTCEGFPEFVRINYLMEFLLFSSIALLCYFFWHYLEQEIEEESGRPKKKQSVSRLLVHLAGTASIMLLVINRWNGYFFYMDEAGVYHRGPYFFACWIGPAVMLICSTILILNQDIRVPWKVVQLSYTVLPLIVYPMQMAHDKMMPLNMAVTFSLLLMYCVNYMNRRKLLLQQKELLAVTEKEMLELEVQLMISQIQPHFLYNTIAMIRGLCREDPDAAAESLGYFSSFLRGSLHMMQEKECITIEEELKLVDAYMYLEQKRFGDRLEYIEDVEDVSFRLPAMTIEPILENAVHHGIQKKEGGGMVLLEVTDDDASYIVRITDDGAGFDTEAPVDTKKHVGMTNVKERLRTMCDGTLEFESVIGEGTTATIRIPKKGKP